MPLQIVYHDDFLIHFAYDTIPSAIISITGIKNEAISSLLIFVI